MPSALRRAPSDPSQITGEAASGPGRNARDHLGTKRPGPAIARAALRTCRLRRERYYGSGQSARICFGAGGEGFCRGGIEPNIRRARRMNFGASFTSLHLELSPSMEKGSVQQTVKPRTRISGLLSQASVVNLDAPQVYLELHATEKEVSSQP